jgi:hypothetical protein
VLLETAGQIFEEHQERNWKRMPDGNTYYGGQSMDIRKFAS